MRCDARLCTSAVQLGLIKRLGQHSSSPSSSRQSSPTPFLPSVLPSFFPYPSLQEDCARSVMRKERRRQGGGESHPFQAPPLLSPYSARHRTAIDRRRPRQTTPPSFHSLLDPMSAIHYCTALHSALPTVFEMIITLLPLPLPLIPHTTLLIAPLTQV